MFSRRSAFIDGMEIGGKAPVRIQTMLSRPLSAEGLDPVVEEIASLAAIGCDIVRIAFASKDDAAPFSELVKRSAVPLVADIHFDWRMALAALEAGAAKIRINPGNIGAEWKVKEVVAAAMDKGAAIRIGLNSGSLPERYSSLGPSRAMVESALGYIDLFESWGFENTVVSLKSSDTDETMEAARLFAALSPYPQHIGVTEAGSPVISAVRSAWALGNLLSEGIGDTIRISMTGDRESEVIAAVELLRTLGLRKGGVRIISCPRCGRCSFDTISFEKKVRHRLLSLDKDISVAIMGCPVNGPGEARGADYAVTGLGREVCIYSHGNLLERVDADMAEDALLEVICSD